MNNYVVATVKPWNIKTFQEKVINLPGQWHLINKPEELSLDKLNKLKPKYIFFPHWSWIVSQDILEKYECVCIHMTDLPYGKGGSPLQNLITRGHSKTKVSAIKMIKKVDSGPIYLKKTLSLVGRAENIFYRYSKLAFLIIEEIVKNEPKPKIQKGREIVFKRRSPEESKILKKYNIKQIFNHIRMLDAETYPKAFIDWGKFNIKFSHAKLNKDGNIETKAIFYEKSKIFKK